MKQKIFLLVFVLEICFLFGCKKTDTIATAPIVTPVDPCIGITINPAVDKGFTISGQSLGTITVTAPIGSGFTYSITGTTFQGSTNFSNLAAGSYTVTAKNANSCVGTTSVTINSYGAKFYEVRKIVNGYCGPCHLNGTISGGRNFDADNSIVAAWDRIKARTVDGLPSFMPQGGQLTALDKQKIVDWVNAGHLTTN
jgi:hypothetical protein